MIPRYVLILLTSVMLISGCAGKQPPRTTVEPRPLGSTLPAPDVSAPTPIEDEPTGDLSLRDALALALLRNPQLQVWSWEVRAREAEALQAGLRPNPQLSLEVENIVGSGVASDFDAMETTLALSQIIQLGGKRAARSRVATLDRDLAAWDYEAQRIAVLNEVARAFLDVLAAQELLTLTGQLVELAESTLAAVETRVRAGGAAQVEASRARVALGASRIAVSVAEHDLRSRGFSLAATWGSREPRFDQVTGDLESVVPTLPDADSLLALLDQNPDVARWATELERRRAWIESSHASGATDLELAAGVRHFGAFDDYGFVFGVSAPLRLFDRAQGNTRAAEERLGQGRAAREVTLVSVAREIQTQHTELSKAFSEIQALRDEVLPEAERATVLARTSYERGRARLADVLSTLRTQFQLQGRYIGALNRYHTAFTNLESLVGEDLGGNR